MTTDSDRDTVRLTYAELAEARGVTLGAARRMVYRHKWPKQVGNDGLSRIAVPTEFLKRDAVLIDGIIGYDRDDVITENREDRNDVRYDVSTEVTPDAPVMRVVPIDEAVAAFARITTDAITDVTKDVIATLQDAVISLRVQLFAERERAARAEKQVQTLQTQLARRWWRR